MVKHYHCDICLRKIESSEDSEKDVPGYFWSDIKDFDLCQQCTRAMEQAAEELRSKYFLLEEIRDGRIDLRQRVLDDFEWE